MLDDLVNGCIKYLVDALSLHVLQDTSLIQMVKVAELQHKMDARRKRRNPRLYVMQKAKRGCKRGSEV